jgi:rare lipoprotein A
VLFRFAIALAITAALSGCAKRKHVAAHVPSTPDRSETGIASWYGHPYHGRAAANGEIYDMEKMTAAHRTLPFGTWVRVTNLTNGKTVDVRIIDRGPFIEGRIIDLSHAARVRVEIIPPAGGVAAQAQYAIQIGVFQERERAERLRQSMEMQFGSARIVRQSPAGRPNLWRVLVGAVTNLQEANALAEKVRAQTGEALVVTLDP